MEKKRNRSSSLEPLPGKRRKFVDVECVGSADTPCSCEVQTNLEGCELQTQDFFLSDTWLPDDVLFVIFFYLSRMDLLAVRITCKQWEKVSLDPRLNWLVVASMHNNETGIIGNDKHCEVVFLEILNKLRRGGDLTSRQFTLKIPDAYSSEDFGLRPLPVFTEIDGSEIQVGSLRISSLYTGFENIFMKIIEGFDETYKLTVYPRIPEDLYLRWSVLLSLNVRHLETRFASEPSSISKQETEMIYFFVMNDFSLFFEKFSSYTYIDACIPKVNLIRQQPKEGFNIKLHSYQMDAFSWLMHVEDQVEGITEKIIMNYQIW
eukprot:TRINITY_DN5190_c0_g2_i5.p1 TRINITY_DN5190_c0_g2~~TRINITY_DN5190_c0_g2_i5.p1  ORF type:complete len:319 (+),score=50.81 TRINITY_DN5190_c0_g2_i5:63-1019(+)